MGSRTLALRRADTCSTCGLSLPVGTRARWDAETRTVHCTLSSIPSSSVPAIGAGEPGLPALPAHGAAPAPAGIGGASAQREYERRHAARDQRVRARHPKVGGLLLALVDDPTHIQVWAQGAKGERAVAKHLDRLEEAIVLNDRRMRRPDGRLTQANIDHIAITPTGVWVIDAKTHRGKLEVRRTGGLFTRLERLFINGRDQTRLIDGVKRQIAAVATGLSASAPQAAQREQLASQLDECFPSA